MRSIKVLSFLILSIFSLSVLADVNVRGYTRDDGTVVQPHHRSDPDGNSNNNWSTKGNENPYTGKKGTKAPSDNSW